MRYFITLFIFLTILYTDQAQTWTKAEGTSAYINAIYLPDNSDTVYISSDIVPTDMQQNDVQFPNYGVGQQGFRISTDKCKTFGDEILKDYSVYAFYSYPNNKQKMLAAIRQFNEGGIVTSSDGGYTWDLSNIYCLSSSQVINITSHTENLSKLFAAEINSSKGYKYSLDTFKTCETDEQFVIEARDIVTSPFNPNLIFIAGDKSLHQVYRSYDNGKTWLGNVSGLEGKRILCLMPSQWNEAVIIAGVDSLDFNRESHGKGIYMSLDTGKTWKLVGATGKRVFDLAQHPDNPKYMAAACDSGSVFFSGSYGYGWEEHSDGLPDDASVRVVAIADWDGRNGATVLAGTFGKGLYISKNVITDIDENIPESLRILLIAPQPFYEKVRIDIVSSFAGLIKISVYDMLGNQIYTNTMQNNSNVNTFIWHPSYLPNGVYMLHVSNGKDIITTKIIK
jgi:hypothetical protein